LIRKILLFLVLPLAFAHGSAAHAAQPGPLCTTNASGAVTVIEGTGFGAAEAASVVEAPPASASTSLAVLGGALFGLGVIARRKGA
jgi:hypothetical protein